MDIIDLLIQKYNFDLKKFEYLKSKNIMNFLTDILQKLLKVLQGEVVINYCEKDQQYDMILPLNPTAF